MICASIKLSNNNSRGGQPSKQWQPYCSDWCKWVQLQRGYLMAYIIDFVVTVTYLLQEHVDSTVSRGMFRIAEEDFHPP